MTGRIKQEWKIFWGGLGIAQSIGCLRKCNPLKLFALRSCANAPFLLMPRRLLRASRTAAARHPYLEIAKGAVAPWCGSTSGKSTGRAAAPSGAQDSGANAPFRSMQRRLRRASRTAAARHPYLGITRVAIAPWCGSTSGKSTGRAAAPSGAQDSGANAPFRSMQRRLRRASRTAAARHPYLGITRVAIAPWCGSTSGKSTGRAAAPSGAQNSGANAAFRPMPRRLLRASRTAAARHPYLEITKGVAAPLYRPLAKRWSIPLHSG